MVNELDTKSPPTDISSDSESEKQVFDKISQDVDSANIRNKSPTTVVCFPAIITYQKVSSKPECLPATSSTTTQCPPLRNNELLLKTVNHENTKTKEVLKNLNRNVGDLKTASTTKTTPTHGPSPKNSRKSPAMETEGNDHFAVAWSSGAGEEEQSAIWGSASDGKKGPIVLFCCTALSKPSVFTVGQKYHLTFKTINADAKLISQICHAHGFHEVHASNCDYNLVWTGVHPKPHQYKSMLPHQRVNHFPRSYELTRKDRLYQNIERMQHAKGTKHFNFVPKTFMIPNEYSEFAAAHHRTRGAWIVKPVASSRGRGIFLISHPNQVPLDEPMVVAKYIDNPLLVNGHKWDLRLYVAVTSYDPLIIYLFEEGLVRFATVRYDATGKNLWNPCMHLCNYSINKYHSDYIKCDDPDQEDQGHKWTLSALLRHLKANSIDTVALMQTIEDIIIKSIISVEFPVNSACKMFVPHRRNCFELYGFDILIDSDLKPWLLEVNLSPSLNCESPIDLKIKSAMLCDLLSLIGLPATDPVLRRAQFNKKVLHMTQDDTSRRLPSNRRSVSMETRRFAAIRLAASTSTLAQEWTNIIRNAREENQRRGGWLRIFPSNDTWSKYGQFLEFSSPNNQLLHEHLFPETIKRSLVTQMRIRRPATKQIAEYLRKRSQSLGVSQCDRQSTAGSSSNNETKENEDSFSSNLEDCNLLIKQTKQTKMTASEMRMIQYETSLTKGHRSKSNVVATSSVVASSPSSQNFNDDHINEANVDEEKVDSKTSQKSTSRQKRILEKREHSAVLRVKIIKMIESGNQLSEYQARKAFSVYLAHLLRRLSDFDGTEGGTTQIDLVFRFLQKASLSLREPYFLKAPNSKLNGKDKAAIVAKELNEFLGHYRRETELFTTFKEEPGMVPRHTFEEFIAFATDSDLEEVLSLQTKLYRCAHIFLGKCIPPVTGRKSYALLRTAYNMSPDRNLRDKQCSMRINARSNPPTAPQFILPSQPPTKCLDISTKSTVTPSQVTLIKKCVSDDGIQRIGTNLTATDKTF